MRTKMVFWMVGFIVALSVAAKADIAFSDDFEDQNRDGWYKQADSSTSGIYNLSVVDDPNTGDGNAIDSGYALYFEDTGTGSTYRKLVANTALVDLTEPNDYVTLSFDMRFVNDPVIVTDRAFRFGIHNSMATVVVGDETADDTCDDDEGYYLRLDTGTGGELRIYPDGTSPGILGGSESSVFTGSYATFNDNKKHHIDFTIRLDPTTGTQTFFEIIIDGAVINASRTSAPYTSFNQIDFGSAYGNDYMFDNVVVTSNKVYSNSPPAVPAGYAIIETNTATPLDGSYVDDGNPEGGTVTYAWSVVNPAQEPNVLFSDASIEDPTVTINAPGMYELQLEVSDGDLSGSGIYYIHAKDASMFNTLQAHWKFDDANDVDDYYYKKTLTVGTPSFNEPNAISGKCLSLGLGDRLEFGKAIGAEESISVAFWAMPKDNALSQSARGIVSKYPDDGTAPFGGWTAQWRSANEMRFRVGKNYGSGGGDNSVTITDGFAFDTWVHIAVIFDAAAGESYFYRNGVLVGTDATSNMAFDPTTILQIGQANWSGLIDEMYLYDYAIDLAKVRELYTLDGGNMPPLVTPDDIIVKGTVSPATIPLSVTIVDENPTTSATWTKVEGPGIVTVGTVTIADGTASADVTFSAVGDYTLTASATDAGGLTGTSQEFIVKVRPVGFNGLEALFDFDGQTYSNNAGAVTYTGTPAGSPVWTSGLSGGAGDYALGLDGTTGHVDFNKYLGAENEITVMFWLKADAAGLAADQHVIQKWASNTSAVGWMTRVRGAEDNFAAMVGSGFNGPGAYVQAPATLHILANTWTHLALTFDGTLVNIYQDGVLVNSVDPAGTYSPADIVSPFVMGYRQNNASSFFNGAIDEVRVYDSALTQAQIVAQFEADGGTLPTTCISAALVPDFDQNCYVNTDDLAYMASVWLTADATADIGPVVVDGPDGDGNVDMVDFSVMAQQWLDCVDPTDSNCL